VTHSQLYQFARLNHSEVDRRVFNWRVRRLVRSGLIRKQVLPFLGSDALYAISRPGIQALEHLGTYYLTTSLEREKDPSEAQIPHVLEVNNIRLAVLRAHPVATWIPEQMVRVLNLSPNLGYAKVYDGIVKIYVDGRPIQFALEYERTIKSLPKYDRIRQAIESETRLNVFLYLVPTVDLLLNVAREFRGTRRFVFVGYLNEFKHNVLDTAVNTPELDTIPLRMALANVSALEGTCGGVALRDVRRALLG
jgi:hypothetical protein